MRRAGSESRQPERDAGACCIGAAAGQRVTFSVPSLASNGCAPPWKASPPGMPGMKYPRPPVYAQNLASGRRVRSLESEQDTEPNTERTCHEASSPEQATPRYVCRIRRRQFIKHPPWRLWESDFVWSSLRVGSCLLRAARAAVLFRRGRGLGFRRGARLPD